MFNSRTSYKKYFYPAFLFLLLVLITPFHSVKANPTSTSTGLDIQVKLNNPLNDSIKSIPDLIVKILKIVRTIAIPIVVLLIIWAGFKFVWARGNPTELTKAREALMWTLIGAAILLGATLLVEIIKGTVKELSYVIHHFV